MTYRKRVIDSMLSNALNRAGAVLIEGAKGCGKTSTAEQAAGSVARVDVDPSVALYMQVEPKRVLAGATPRLLDEWQRQPLLWDLVRRAVDDRQKSGQFILTGSASPDSSVPRHSGAGRFAVLRMRPMSLWEDGTSRGEVSLSSLRQGAMPAMTEPGSEDMAFWADVISRGGWPTTLQWPLRKRLTYVADYLSLLAQVDTSEVAETRRDPARVSGLLRSIARNTSTEAAARTLGMDAGGRAGSLSRNTVAKYLDALERLMVIEPLPAWQTSLRDSATLRQAPAWHFVDPSLAVAAMRATPMRLVAEPKTLGLLFESLALRDIRIYAAHDGGQVFRARDSAGREVDAVIEYPEGWVACEIKLGMGQVDDAAASLTAFVRAVDTQSVGPCLSRLVIVGNGPGYFRPDGIQVVPLAALRP